ncbi:PREDICTED: zinc finger protein 845-like isoform X1 [Wasmannia auropunctata]|uniref:zinc finger protein 845-like isoform X1 n=1 Tax=Wasmannia auropunctata TaxID=64793 RepID=UPI0005EFF6A9|nr:PREDICTED: zinc finger protein 845-like isoform X1 [Wasmannia auropunctata]XP_011693667.1 PREDICTED: zinc finger protein 845-like isoform X1 [Wasmannia auropunctata]
MESYEEDDDTHFCIKCNLTIHGLDNYVRHRRSGCRPSDVKIEIAHEPPSTPTTVSYPEILNADAFFSSLELQSNARRAPTLLDNRKFKKDDKRKKDQKGQVDGDEAGAKDKLHSMLPAVSDLDEPPDLCIQSLKQNTLDRKRHENQQSWLEDDTILADLSLGNSANKELARYDFEYDDSEDDMLEEELGEDSYSDSDDGENREGPPRDHTGGKWKPGLDDLPQDTPHMHEEDAEPDDDHQEHPPPTYTGGKWRPTETSQKVEEYESKNTSGQPPPGHTRGKWVPGARTDIESGYWCNPCGRKLASRLVYNRHLLSDLHARRSIRELDGEALHLRRGINSHARVSRRVSTRKKTSLAMRTKEEPEQKKVKKGLRRREKEILLCEMCRTRVRRPQMGKHLLSHYHCRVSGVLVNPRNPSVRRFLLEHIANVVRQSPFQCAPCRFYCNTEETFLLHWRSDLHSKTVKQIGGSCRCTPCNFWCADNATMESHLLSTSHRDVVSMMKGSVPVVISRQRTLSCGSCDRQFRYNFQLRLHARETGHTASHTASDVYQQRIKCDLCPQVLRSLVALQRHQLTNHVTKDKEKSEVVVDARPTPYFCSFCSMNFITAQEAVLHRRTSSHKETVKARKSEEGLLDTERDCPHCDQKQPNLAAHKNHLLLCHSELCHRCPRCGTLFALSQDVTRHTREGNCLKNDKSDAGEAESEEKEWKCKECIFSTDSKAEFIFHEALHAGAVEETNKGSGSSKLPKYKCPTCAKAFPKTSLRNHIRQHTGEKPFPCMRCSISFARRSLLIIHQRLCSTSSKSLDKTGRRRSFICSHCKEGFYTKHALRQHMLRHAGKKYKCGLPGCPTILRTATELKTHRRLVHDNIEKQYSCPDCSYAAKTKTQLRRHRIRHEDSANAEKVQIHSCTYKGCNFKTKLGSNLRRHVRLHTGAKPYKCRHCPYASNTLENLRKHILSTNLHPGKTIYECDFCKKKKEKETDPFCTNFAKELRAHLLEVHAEDFPTPNDANNYTNNIFRPN